MADRNKILIGSLAGIVLTATALTAALSTRGHDDIGPLSKPGDRCHAQNPTRGRVYANGFLKGHSAFGYYIGQSLASARQVAISQGHLEIPYTTPTNGRDWSDAFQGEKSSPSLSSEEIFKGFPPQYKLDYIRVSASGNANPVVTKIEVKGQNDKVAKDRIIANIFSIFGMPTWSYSTKGECIYDNVHAYGSSRNLARPNQLNSFNCFSSFEAANFVVCTERDKPHNQWMAISHFDRGFVLMISNGATVK